MFHTFFLIQEDFCYVCKQSLERPVCSILICIHRQFKSNSIGLYKSLVCRHVYTFCRSCNSFEGDFNSQRFAKRWIIILSVEN